MHDMAKTLAVIRTRLVKRNLMRLDCSICTVPYGNGVETGQSHIRWPSRRLIRWVHRPGFCVRNAVAFLDIKRPVRCLPSEVDGSRTCLRVTPVSALPGYLEPTENGLRALIKETTKLLAEIGM